MIFFLFDDIYAYQSKAISIISYVVAK